MRRLCGALGEPGSQLEVQSGMTFLAEQSHAGVGTLRAVQAVNFTDQGCRAKRV